MGIMLNIETQLQSENAPTKINANRKIWPHIRPFQNIDLK